MAMQWIGDVRQAAIIDEAEQVAHKHLADSMEEVREAYASVGFDVLEAATRLRDLAREARLARAVSEAAQDTYEVEASQSRAVVAEADKWMDQLRRAVRFARLKGHPLGEGIEHPFAKLEADSWSKSMHSMVKALVHLQGSAASLQRYGLPADFVTRGKALAAALQDESKDAAQAGTSRQTRAIHLNALLDEIVAEFELFDAARDFAMAMTGKELPGFELSLVRGAAARRSSTRTTEGTPERAPADADATGL